MKRLACALGLAAVACSPSPTSPTPPIYGTVYDLVTSAPVPGARVRFADGVGKGAITDQNGSYTLAGGSHLRSIAVVVEKDGYEAREAPCCIVYLDPLDGRLRVPTGEYRLTFAFDPGCSGIPPEFRTTSFTATVERFPAKGVRQGVGITVREPGFSHGWGWGFLETSEGIAVPEETYGGWQAPSGLYIGVSPPPMLVVDPSAISLPFWGSYCPNPNCVLPPRGAVDVPANVFCDSPNNRMTLTRR